MIRIFIGLLIMFFLSSCEKPATEEVDAGIFSNSVYKNKFFKLTMMVPNDWQVQSAAVHEKLRKESTQNAAGRNEKLKEAIKDGESEGVGLFLAFKYLPGKKIDYNPLFRIAAERIRNVHSLKTPRDYHERTKLAIEASPMYASFPKKIFVKKLGGVDFTVLTINGRVKGKTLIQKQYTTFLNDYALTISYSTIDEVHEKEFEKVLSGLTFEH